MNSDGVCGFGQDEVAGKDGGSGKYQLNPTTSARALALDPGLKDLVLNPAANDYVLRLQPAAQRRRLWCST